MLRCKIFGHKISRAVKRQAISDSESHIVRCILDNNYFGSNPGVKSRCVRCGIPLTVYGDNINRNVTFKKGVENETETDD